MKTIDNFITFAEVVNKKIGRGSSYLIFAFMSLMVYEVISRYFFASPTIWVHELCGYIFAAYVALTGGWVLLEKGHVAVDIIYQHFPEKGKYLADIAVSITSIFMFSILFWQGSKYAWHAFVTGQHSHTLFHPLLWPVKMMLPIGALLFLLQIFADLARSIIKYKDRSTL